METAETAPLDMRVTCFKGLLWFRSTDAGVCFSLRPTIARLALKSLPSVFRVTRPKTDPYDLGPFHVQIDSVPRITLPLALPNLEEKMVPVSRGWLEAIQPFLVRAIYIIDLHKGLHDFSLVYDGDEIVETAVDRQSIPPQGPSPQESS